MKNFDIITIFPEMIDSYANASILGRAQKKRLIKITSRDLRYHSKNKHKKVDDKPYGGGPGMIMTVQPIDNAVRAIKSRCKKKSRVILTSASGKIFTQKDAKRLSKYDRIIFICGRYEGVDARIEKEISDESFSIGKYILTGGELPALVMTDAIARHVTGVLGSAESLIDESYSKEDELEYPQYTKPEEYIIKKNKRGKKKISKVPKILLSGNHAKIKNWREENKKSIK